MISTRDIRIKMGIYLVKEGYNEVDIIGKKKLIESGLRKYLISKLVDFGYNNIISDNSNPELTALELLEIIADSIPDDDIEDVISQLTHYILDIAGELQGRTITWWVEDDEEMIQLPHIDFNKEEYWDNLKTHMETSHIKVFNWVYKVFNEEFMVNKKPKMLTLEIDNFY